MKKHVSDRSTSYLLTTERPKHLGSLMWLAALWFDHHTRFEACVIPAEILWSHQSSTPKAGEYFLASEVGKRRHSSSGT